ncbi:MAG: PEP-CTERM sorting domain-containing protein [Pirellulales bacterium]|nr:PEP-CTERM sorting domain-containing protein [Pirellulales bacterium]
MKRFQGLLCFAAILGLAFSTSAASAGLVDGSVESIETKTSWRGFEPDFKPAWDGETELVRWIPPSPGQPSSGVWTSGIMMYQGPMYRGWDGTSYTMNTGGYWVTRWTVNKISSSSWASTSVSASVQGLEEVFTASKEHSDDDGALYADFARVMTTDGHLLTQGSAIAVQDLSIEDHEFNVGGRIMAMSLALDEALDGSASAEAQSIFDAVYDLEQDTPYILNLNLASFGDTDIAFTVTDVNSDEVVLSYIPTSRVDWQVEQTGTLEPGRYKFELQCSAVSSADTDGTRDPGGMASYAIDLAFAAEQYDVWVGGLVSLIPIPVPGSTSSVPEPGSIALLIAAVGSLALLARRKTKISLSRC